jgi:hypothetical protein
MRPHHALWKINRQALTGKMANLILDEPPLTVKTPRFLEAVIVSSLPIETAL